MNHYLVFFLYNACAMSKAFYVVSDMAFYRKRLHEQAMVLISAIQYHEGNILVRLR